MVERDNVRVIRAAGDVVFVGADIIAKLSAETSLDRAPAASRSTHCYHAQTQDVPALAATSRRTLNRTVHLRTHNYPTEYAQINKSITLSNQHSVFTLNSDYLKTRDTSVRIRSYRLPTQLRQLGSLPLCKPADYLVDLARPKPTSIRSAKYCYWRFNSPCR